MKIGIYGGTFSPPHRGHISIAEEFLRFAELDRLLVIPAGSPPHKKVDGGADAMSRLEMCRAAFSGISPKVEVSDIEAHRTDPCYTVDTLRHFAAEGELYMLCGSDMFLTLDRWRDPVGIFSLCTVVCGTRVDDTDTRQSIDAAAQSYRDRFGARVMIMDHSPVEVSSTLLREALVLGERPGEITDEVFAVIERLGLYGFKKEQA